jgi:hypothetical protein
MYISTLGLIGIKWRDPSRLTYKIPKSVMKLAKDAGLKKTDDFLEFWFKNRNNIVYELNDGVVGGQVSAFEKIHKWLTPIGKQCSKSLQLFINSNQNKFPVSDSQHGRKRRLEVSKFTFEFKDEIFDLEKFHRHLNLIPCNKRIDLSGVTLHHINLTNFIVDNFDLEHARLYDCKFDNSIFSNTGFYGSELKCCQFSRVVFDENCSFMVANLYGCQFSHTDLNDVIAAPTIRIKKVSYFYLLIALFDTFKGSFENDIVKNNVIRYMKHNSFIGCRTDEVLRSENRWLKEYVDWYQNVMFNLGSGFDRMSTIEKFSFFFSIVCTKCWSSFKALALTGTLVALIFSAIYYYLPPFSLNGYDDSWLTAIYFSIVTFTTLGFGDISPATELAKVIVILEVILGYIVLGSFVLLLGRKVNTKY